MAIFTSKKQNILAACGLALVLIVGAYFAAHPFSNTAANAASTDDLLKAYAAKDTDGDGLPDWEESLYGTDPNNPHSVSPSLTDSQAVAQGLATPKYAGQPVASSTATDIGSQIPAATAADNTITNQFAELFFNNYMATRGASQPSASDMQQFVQEAVIDLEQTRSRPDAYTTADLVVKGSGPGALATYAAGADAAFAANIQRLPYGELTYFSDAVDKNDASALANVASIGTAYTKTAQALIKVPVPQEAATGQLAVANSMARLGDTISSLATVNDDPIRAMMALGDYGNDTAQLANALANFYPVFVADNVTLTLGEPGYGFYSATADAASGEAATTTP